MNNSYRSLLRLMQLISPSTPVGAYAYSQGLEQAVAWGWVQTEQQLEDWICGVLSNSILSQDAPLLIRLYNAWESKDHEQLLYWNQYLLACRETRELRQEEMLLGQALTRLLITLDMMDLQALQEVWQPKSSLGNGAPICYATAFSCAGVNWNIDLSSLLLGYGWAWAENQMMAALKLLPIGQSAGQRILSATAELLAAETERCFAIEDDAIAGALPGLAHASSAHESQYSRLFRS
ncbi:MAG TPA: urease accessory protein UreF [Porticoccaceae bacterium]|jgi:urease accessory protein|nr:urease accessory protein UreF [Gammaproteobacteria bacterium]HIL60339.1 urease accessory protein UreF [Porticoccaceae bacterium]